MGLDIVAIQQALGDDELDERAGTIPQALLRMNGEFTRDSIKTGPFTASGRIVEMSDTDEQLIENCYLVCLTRRPTPEEQEHFLEQLTTAPKHQRDEITQDLFWSLMNSPEFSWNH